ncbi:MAG: tetratricopeptide repeat protein [Magnetococcales bacterium]|nr:tetratricopeptide repeat protein [Magnetococcales bacterium]
MMSEDDKIKAELRNLSGQQFEDFFCDLMEIHHGSDFQRVRPCPGDEGVDGYLLDKDHIFACYGSQGGKAPARYQTKKIKDDFEKAVNTATNRPLGFKKWTFVHNHVDGLAISAVTLLKKLKKDNPKIKISTFSFQEFKAIWKKENLFSSSLQPPKEESPTPKTELDWLLPEYQHIPLLGRNDQLKEYMEWLTQDEYPVSLRILTGAGGRGKTRFAWELCRKAQAKKWSVGFLNSTALKSLLIQTDKKQLEWYQPTLVVVDYAAILANELNQWFNLLLALPKRKRLPLRILLLERNATWKEGWCATALGDASFGAKPLQDFLNPSQPQELPQLPTLQFRRGVLAAVIQRLKGKNLPPIPGRDKKFDKQLLEAEWGGHPLYLLMAGILAAKSGLADLLSLSNVDLAMELAKRELARIAKFAEGETKGLLLHLAAYITLCEGLGYKELMAVIKEEKELLGYDNAAGRKEMVKLLQQVLPTPTGKGATPVRPDMIGEALTILALENQAAVDCPPVAVRALAHSQNRALAAMVRCGQDFIFQGERYEPLDWLKSIVEQPDISLEMLVAIFDEMPRFSLGLVEFTAQILERIVEILRGEIGEDEEHEKIPRLSIYLNNLSIRLSELGYFEEALEKNQEVVKIDRKLSAIDPDVYMPGLASSLNNIAAKYSNLGENEEALASAKEAVDIYRERSTNRLDVYLPDLAASLSNLANRFNKLGQNEATITPAKEAVEIRRKLSADRPDVYLPDLAASLSNIAGFYIDLRQNEEALTSAQEAEEIYRKLSTVRPDVYMPDLAHSLGNLARCYSMLDQPKEAHCLTKEAIEKLRDAFFKFPKTYQQWMDTSVWNYRIYCERLQQEPDMELLGPIVELLIKLMKDQK